MQRLRARVQRASSIVLGSRKKSYLLYAVPHGHFMGGIALHALTFQNEKRSSTRHPPSGRSEPLHPLQRPSSWRSLRRVP